MIDEEKIVGRRCAVQTAQIWYDGAKRKSLTSQHRLVCMENAFNHTENALFSAKERADKLEKVVGALLRALTSTARFLDEANYPKVSAEIRGIVDDCASKGLLK